MLDGGPTSAVVVPCLLGLDHHPGSLCLGMGLSGPDQTANLNNAPAVVRIIVRARPSSSEFSRPFDPPEAVARYLRQQPTSSRMRCFD